MGTLNYHSTLLTILERYLKKAKPNKNTKEQTKKGFEVGFFSATNENKYRKMSDQ